MIFTNTLFHTFIPGSFPPQTPDLKAITTARVCVCVFVCVCVRHSGCHAKSTRQKNDKRKVNRAAWKENGHKKMDSFFEKYTHV